MSNEIYRDADADESVDKDLEFLGYGWVGGVVKLVFGGVLWKVFGRGNGPGVEGESGESKTEVRVEAEGGGQ